jgi:hypothetical protein
MSLFVPFAALGMRHPKPREILVQVFYLVRNHGRMEIVNKVETKRVSMRHIKPLF